MSLRWSLTDVKDWETVCYMEDESLHPVTQQIVFATIGAGMPTITKENAGEFYARLTVMQQVHGGKGWILQRESDSEEWVNRFITADEVRAHIGLTTNASALSRAKFLSSQVTGGMDEMVRSFNEEVVAP